MAEPIGTARMLNSGDSGMKAPRMAAPTAPPRLLTLALFAILGCASEGIAAPSCLDFSATPFTIKIYNNSANYNIFPVVVTPTNGPDEWLQGGFQVPTADIGTRTYGHNFTYRFYIKPVVGIAQGQSVTLSLPLCTQLVGNPGDGSPLPPSADRDEWIDWWNGLRILIYANPGTNSKLPPAALSNDLAADEAKGPIPLFSPGPACTAGCGDLHRPIYWSSTQVPPNDPYQLTEYTLADVVKGSPGVLHWSLDTKNVDYDISYVDETYLPVAMGPIGNPDVGWVGSISGINKFRGVMGNSGLMQFLTAQPGWPQYLDPSTCPASPGDQPPPITCQKYLRIPGTYNAFAQWNPKAQRTITQRGQAIQDLRTQWTTCTTTPDNSTLCQDIQAVQGLFVANYTNYLNLVAQGSCNPPGQPLPTTPGLNDILKRVYGWVPWNENCHGGAAANALSDTPGYNTVLLGSNPPSTKEQIVHRTYIALQYLPPLGTFNPYVNLVHGPTFLDILGSYAFSIDDVVGNIHIPGQGVIVTVGGPNGLDNLVQYEKNKIVNLALGDPAPGGKPAWQQFVRCGVPSKPIEGLGLTITSAIYPCMVELTDASGRSYTFTLASPPYPPAPPTSPISACTVTPPDTTTPTWCSNATAKTEPDPNTPGVDINSVSLAPPL